MTTPLKQKLQLGHYHIDHKNHEITGFYTVAEYEAYELGRDHMAKVYDKFIKEWDGSTNSAMGQILHDLVLKGFKQIEKN